IRERWTAVQAAVLQLEETAKKKDRTAAIKQLRDFHEWMRGLSFLDPACGSGNFLYVTMAAVKRIELEVLNEIARLSHGQGGLVLDEVHPRQFHGIEVKPWAREIAELTLWIGYHQFWRESHGGRTPPDPILEDTGTIECRDAVLAWDAIVHRPEKDRPDPTPRIVHPVTGELVPDPNAKLPYYEYVGARQAEWPRADFIVGNPPYIGNKRMRESLGDGYVDYLRACYPNVSITADFVMYWWSRSSTYVAKRETLRAGLITTNTITQVQNRAVVDSALAAGATIVWAIPDHPWIEDAGGAAIRIAMTVVAYDLPSATLLSVDKKGNIIIELKSQHLNSDLSASADVSTAAKIGLHSNLGVASRGFQLVGAGFILNAEEATRFLANDERNSEVVRPYRNGKDLTARSRQSLVIDFGLRSEEEARQYPLLCNRVIDSVRPDRLANARASYARNWWRFGEPRPAWRSASSSLMRYVATPQTAKHRFFVFLDQEIAPDDMVIAFATEDPFHLGVLSSAIHCLWALATGGRLGVGNDPRYNQSLCFGPFPFANPSDALRAQIRGIAERLDVHRKSAIAGDERVTMTGMYNVVEKLRSGAPLTPKERAIHEIAACGVLRDLHDELDQLVAEAYGWPWPMGKEEILERLVALHDERVEEEKRGIIRWLRPDYQIPRFAASTPAATLDLTAGTPETPAAIAALPAWPTSPVDQLAAISALVSRKPVSVEEATTSFTGARRDLVLRHLGTLELMGEIVLDADGRYQPARKVA
ncbi:MAG TPA: DNA methyltransferase, partial [Gemmatimonadaceae bacterium]